MPHPSYDALETIGVIEVSPPLTLAERAHFSRWQTAWTPCADGCCLRLASAEDPQEAVSLLRGLARSRHVAGLVVARDAVTGQVFSVRAHRRITSRVIETGIPRPPELAPVIELSSRRASDDPGWR